MVAKCRVSRCYTMPTFYFTTPAEITAGKGLGSKSRLRYHDADFPTFDIRIDPTSVSAPIYRLIAEPI